MDDLKKIIQQEVADALGDFTEDLMNELIENSPKDSSRLVSNYNASIGSPENAFNESLQDNGVSARQEAKSVSNSLKTGKEKVFITSSVPYILPNNDLTAQDVSPKFLERSIAQAIKKFK